jgi:deoxycytidylate deaminase
MCAKSIVNSGIYKVVYHEEYRDTSSLKILRDAGIEVVKFISNDDN